MPQREWQSLFYGVHQGQVIHSDNGVEIIACSVCGFNHVVPLPDPLDLKEFYEETFYQDEKARYLTEAEEDFEWKKVEFESRFSVAHSHLGAKPGRALDVGCGPGDFLKVGQSLGWDVVGIEPSPVAARYASERGLNVTNAFFNENTAAELGTFDFIHMSEVLEHIAEPEALIKLAKTLLKPDGLLCVSVPNDFSPIQGAVVDALEKPAWWVVPDHHLNYFDFDSLERLLVKTDLNVVEKTTNFPMELFLLMGQDYTKDPALGRAMHQWRKNLDINLAKAGHALPRTFYSALATAGFGRLAILFATHSSND
jgi:2-polyprenyl-3-methyl-5-hydroxy-6-metoxy-1,4-benzoquinol methylase